jgi:hypothetical protein
MIEPLIGHIPSVYGLFIETREEGLGISHIPPQQV